MIVGKKCKTRGGFQRHRASKHTHGTLTPGILAEIVNTALVNIKRSIVFAKGLRNELDFYVYEQLVDGTLEFSLLKSLFDGYLDKGDSEKFYAKYYTQVPLHSANFFKGLLVHKLYPIDNIVTPGGFDRRTKTEQLTE